VECNLVRNHTRDFKIERVRNASSIWNHRYDFRPKLHDTKFNCHFIKSILKSHNCFIALNFRFGSWFVKIAEPETSWHHLVCKTMSCNENSLEYNKEKSSSEVRTKTVYFTNQSSILVAWINDGRPSFSSVDEMRLRLLAVFEEGIWRCS